MRHQIRVADERHGELLRRLYQAAAVDLAAGGEEFVAAGRRLTWALDLRRPLLRSELLQPAAEAVAERLQAVGATQIAGQGLGAAPLVCGVVAQARGIDGALLREQPKRRNFLRPFEGELDRGRPVWLIDDLVNSGRSVVAAASLLRVQGLEVAGVVCLFHYAWGTGRERLRRHRLYLEPLAELRRRAVSPSRSFGLQGRLTRLAGIPGTW
jgi:orotate phosphoribosyltransferase